MKAQGRKKGEGRKRERKEMKDFIRRRKKRGCKKMEWWRSCRDLDLEENRQEKEEGTMRERKRKTGWSVGKCDNGSSSC